MNDKEKLIVDIDLSEVENRLLQTVVFEYNEDPDVDESKHGWYIVFKDALGEAYDSVGPYDTKEEAQHVMQQSRSE